MADPDVGCTVLVAAQSTFASSHRPPRVPCGLLLHQHRVPGGGYTVVDHAYENNERDELVPA